MGLCRDGVLTTPGLCPRLLGSLSSFSLLQRKGAGVTAHLWGTTGMNRASQINEASEAGRGHREHLGLMKQDRPRAQSTVTELWAAALWGRAQLLSEGLWEAVTP